MPVWNGRNSAAVCVGVSCSWPTGEDDGCEVHSGVMMTQMRDSPKFLIMINISNTGGGLFPTD